MGWMASTVLFIVILLSAYWASESRDSVGREGQEAEIVASNMMVYASSVRTYLKANPSASGTISSGSLGLPSWFSANSQITNLFSSGVAYVYCPCSDMRDSVAEALNSATNGSYFVGIKKAGTFTNLNHTTSATIALPAAIPEGAVVYVIK